MANGLTYGQGQAERNLKDWQGLSGKMREPSIMASPEEKAAYAAQQVRSGNAPESELPEAYGGRPQGTTRRSMRMQAAWDAAAALEIERQKALKEEENSRVALQLRINEDARQQAQMEINKAASVQADLKENTIKEHALELANAITGYIKPDGTFQKGISIDDEDAVEKLQSLAIKYDQAGNNPIASELYKTKLKDAIEKRNNKIEKSRLGELSALDLSIRTNKPMSAFGEYDERGVFNPNVQSMAIEKSKLDVSKEEAAAVAPQIQKLKIENNTIDDEIITTSSLLDRETNKKVKGEYEAKLESLRTRKFKNDLNVIDLDPSTRNLPRVKSAEELAKIKAGDPYVSISPVGINVVIKTEKKPEVQPQATTAPVTAEPQNVQQPARPEPQKEKPTSIQVQEELIKESDKIINNPNSDFLDRAKAQADKASAQKKIDEEAAKTPKVRRAEQAARAQQISAKAGASLQDELNKYYNTIFEAGSFNPATGTPTKVKGGIDAKTLKQALERIKSLRVSMGEDPRNVDPELEQIYIDATR